MKSTTPTFRTSRLLACLLLGAAALLSPAAASAQWATSGSDVNNTNTGNVGVGTAAPSGRLTVDANSTTNVGIRVKNTAGSSVFAGVEYLDNTGNVRVFSGFQPSTGEFRFNNIATGGYLDFRIGGDSKFRVASDGNVGIGTTSPVTKLHVAGDLTVTGNISAKYQDVAEWVPSTQKLSAGTVVVLDGGQVNHVLASTTPYDTRVAGVVSAQPGLILGEGGEGKLMVATTGRVKVRVDATRSPIKVGDLLVSSGAEGVAMKSVAVELGGVAIHRPGTIIGKALEPLTGGVGEILVLLSLQ